MRRGSSWRATQQIVVDIDADREALIADGDPTFPVRTPDDEWLAIALNNTSGTIGNLKCVVLQLVPYTPGAFQVPALGDIRYAAEDVHRKDREVRIPR